jgi:type I restriction enzyme R subunit
MLGLREYEEDFYDALNAADGTALGVPGDSSLREIPKQLFDTVRKYVRMDWTVKEAVKAKLRLNVKRILKEQRNPPSGQETATQTVLHRQELLSAQWA